MDFKAALTRFGTYLHHHSARLTWVACLLIVSVWTLIRHWTNGVNFDVVGQVGLVDQWSHGYQGGAQIGSTNYILKMPLYWLVNHLGFLGYHGKLLLLALICNLATFSIIFIVLRKILDLYEVQRREWAYLGFLWLATISGSVYWLDYANSRNLETAGGLVLLYLSLVFVSHPSVKKLAAIALCGGIVFFADPLQLFVIGLPLCLFMVLRWLIVKSRGTLATALQYGVATIVGFGISKLLFVLSTMLLPVSFLRLPANYPAWSWTILATSVKETAANTLKVFGADVLKRPYGLNVVREFINLAVLLFVVIVCVKALQKGIKRQLLLLLATVVAVNYLVYMATGQALQWETSRYLLMLPLLATIVIAVYAPPRAGKKAWLKPALFAMLTISTLLLVGALVISWPNRFSKDAPTATAAVYLGSNQYSYALASRETAITTTYYTSQRSIVLPFICVSGEQLRFSNLFFDSGPVAQLPKSGIVPLLVESGGIKSDGNTCDRTAILKQFGAPIREENIPGFGQAEIYPSSQISIGH